MRQHPPNYDCAVPKPRPRLLLISFLFPPYAGIGSVRVGKAARYLEEHGWDVRVLAARAHEQLTLAPELAPDKVTYTEWSEVDRIADFLRGQPIAPGTALPAENDSAEARSRGRPSILRRVARRVFTELVRVPDRYIGWKPFAIKAGQALINEWRPDLIYASAPPYSTLLVARALSLKNSIPWIAEYRDPWTDNPYYEFSWLRRQIERIWEDRVLGSAVGLVSVTPPWVEQLRRRTGLPTELIMNGFVIGDYPVRPPLPPATKGPLRILYAGTLYGGLRDPEPLFKAVAALGADKEEVSLEFLGDTGNVAALAEKYGIGGMVKLLPVVSYRDSLNAQCHADILLNLQSNSAIESGWIPAKIFEYLGARRPILSVGYTCGVVPDLIRERGAGLVSVDAGEIEQFLRRCIQTKRAVGIEATPASVTEGFSRDEQYRALDIFLQRCLERAGHVAG